MKPFLHLPLATLVLARLAAQTPSFPIVDTGQERCFDQRAPIAPPRVGERFHGQDAQYRGLPAAYQDNGDGTITDLNTGLMWSRRNAARKMNLAEAEEEARSATTGGYADWRLPSIKELYSLIDFRGVTGLPAAGSPGQALPPSAVPYLNTDYFEFSYGDPSAGERVIDAQWLTSTVNVSPVMHGSRGVFGVNFADGRIKCYPLGRDPRGYEKRFFVRLVRGRRDYGMNQFVDNRDGTVTDRATGLTWMQDDSHEPMDWEAALAFAEGLEHGGYSDWRLPNAKELQSIVDYTRSPDHTDSPAIDPLFECTGIRNEAGEPDFPYYWTSTTHLDGPNAGQAVYLAFGRAIGVMRGTIMDVHGAGAQRSDPKTGNARLGHGPQGDAQRVRNLVRAVRGGVAAPPPEAPSPVSAGTYPHRIQLLDTSYTPVPMTFREDRWPGGPRFEQPGFPPPPPPPLGGF